MEEEFNLSNQKIFDVLVMGGLGHIGLPLGLVFAQKGLKVCLLDIDENKTKLVLNGIMPFIEYGAEEVLKEVLGKGNLKVSKDISDISRAKHIIVTLGTDVDEYFNPQTKKLIDTMVGIKKYLDSSQILIMRSTVYPTLCRQLSKKLEGINIAYCPERIVQGYAMREIPLLPQVVSGFNERAIKDATELFSKISPKIIETSVEEAELVKLFTNSLRYLQFATTNQFYTMATKLGCDYNKIRKTMSDGYERVYSLPSPGLSGGPCLIKDTLQLKAFDNGHYLLGYSAMMINESMPNFIVDELSKKYDLSKKKVGILGMAFKADIDDIRDSLSYKLIKLLSFHSAKVSCSDEFVRDASFVSKEELIRDSDIIIVGTPHSAYKTISIPENIHLVDLWGIIQNGKEYKRWERV
jgi:UDP-N-acetyl-D-mannosaminuronic acid dehydrogenase